LQSTVTPYSRSVSGSRDATVGQRFADQATVEDERVGIVVDDEHGTRTWCGPQRLDGAEHRLAGRWLHQHADLAGGGARIDTRGQSDVERAAAPELALELQAATV
jgi:hypothetical protein